MKLSGEVGLNADEASAALEGDAFADEVRTDEELAIKLGITGVPFFVVNRKYGISGAQPVKTFLEIFEKAWADLSAR